MEKYIAYYRVSTKAQGIGGLGIDAQKAMVKTFLKGSPPEQEFTEQESGKRDDRKELRKALDICKKTGATLVIAKLDRLSRNLTFISSLMDSKIKFVCADMPEANEFTIHIFAALAQQERKMISDRTKAALKALKDKGIKLGGPNAYKDLGTPYSREQALAARIAKRDRGQKYIPTRDRARSLRKEGFTLQQIADEINNNSAHYSAPKGGKITPVQVSRMLK